MVKGPYDVPKKERSNASCILVSQWLDASGHFISQWLEASGLSQWLNASGLPISQRTDKSDQSVQ